MKSNANKLNKEFVVNSGSTQNKLTKRYYSNNKIKIYKIQVVFYKKTKLIKLKKHTDLKGFTKLRFLA